MFGIGKKNKKKISQDSEIEAEVSKANGDSQIKEHIHVMPKRFYVVQKKKNYGILLIIGGGIILIGGLLVAGYFLNENLKKSQQEEVEVPSVNINRNINNDNNSNQNSNSNANINTVNTNINTDITTTPTTTSTTTPINNNNNSNQNSNSNTNANTNTTVLPPNEFPSAPDLDVDGLTEEEESIYRTDPAKSDTDEDGYSDGREIISGYDPTTQGANLISSGLFNIYNGETFTISHPSEWGINDLGQQDVIFQSSTGEFVQVLVTLNTETTLEDWYVENYTQEEFNGVTSVSIGSMTGYLSADKLSYYLVNPVDQTSVYSIIYNIGRKNQLNFKTTFNVMAKSFILKP